MAYTYITWSALKSALALRLTDSGNAYWSEAELGVYLTEALRTWGLLTGYWRDSGLLATVNTTAFYDITSIQNAGGEELLSYTVTDQDIVTLIQYHFLEPATGNSWTGSEQFTLADLTSAIQRRRDQLLIDTACRITHTEGIATSPGDRSVFLDQSVASFRRLAFIDSSGVAHPLVPDDIMSQRNYDALGSVTPSVPYSYSFASALPLEIWIIPPTNEPGTLDLLSINTGSSLDPTTGVVLGIPDDYTMAVKWGAMADLLGKDGPARDAARAAFCERRYQLFVELIKISPIVVNIDINGIPVNTDSVTNLDYYNSTWQTSTGVPYTTSVMRNMLALSPCPDDVYSVTLDVVRKTPLPADTEFVQIGKEQLDSILDYSEHLASFKMGGVEFKSTYRGAENFFAAALSYNHRLTAQNPNVITMAQQSFRDMQDRPFVAFGSLGALQGQPTSAGAGQMESATQGDTG